MYYNSRWYDPALGRFAQADSIVPPGVQGLDRYAYVNNSPMNYVDPTGHCAIDAKADDCLKSDKSNKPTSEENYQSDYGIFYSDARRIAKNNQENALEGMAKIVQRAAEVFTGDWDDMMRALGTVFIGTPSYGPGAVQIADHLRKVNGLSDNHLYKFFSDTGFNTAYQDGEDQVGHVWAYIANSTILGGYPPAVVGHSAIANVIHEYKGRGGGGSRQDFTLSLAGIEIGMQISNGEISPYDLDDVLIATLGDNANPEFGLFFYWFLPDAPEAP